MRILRCCGLVVVSIALLAIPSTPIHAADPGTIESVPMGAIIQPGVAVDAPYPSLFGPGGFTPGQSTDDPTGDTYGAEPLVQDAVGATFLDDATTSSLTFDTTPEIGGNNVLYTLAVTEMGVANMFIPSAVGGTIIVQIVAFDDTRAVTDWVPAGAIGPNGIFTQWRADVGSTAAVDPINILSLNPGDTITILDSGFTIFDLTGTELGSFPLSLDSSDTTSVSGVAVVGLGGADIAGFGLGSIQLFWEYEVIPVPVELQSFSID